MATDLATDLSILVIGATGQIGHALTTKLANTDNQVTVLVRDAGKVDGSAGVRVVESREFDLDTMIAAMQGVDLVIHGVGLPEQYTVDSGIFERVNHGVAQTMLQAMDRTGVRRLVYISTYDIFEATDGMVDESSSLADPAGLSAYFKSMSHALTTVESHARTRSFELTTIHPAAVYGGLNTGFGFTNVIENLLNWRVWRMPTTLAGRFPLVHAISLADAIVRSLDHTGRFIVVDTMSSLQELARALRVHKRSFVPPQIPVPLAYASVALLEGGAKIIGQRPILAKVQLDFITMGIEPNASRAIKELGWQPMPLATGLQQYLTEREGFAALTLDSARQPDKYESIKPGVNVNQQKSRETAGGHIVLAIALALSMFVAIQPVNAALPETAFPLPDGVTEAGHVELPGSTVQDYFWMTTPFPSTPALPHYENVFALWTTCFPQDGWHALGSSPQRQDHYLHKFIRHWVSPDNTSAVTLLFQYWSPGDTTRILPRNDNQMISVVRTTVSDARSHFKAQGLSCGEKS